jgi:hypothetical protein
MTVPQPIVQIGNVQCPRSGRELRVNFRVQKTYALIDDYLSGDFGLPLPWNEYGFANDVIYETLTVFHSFTGNNNSYAAAKRPSGVGRAAGRPGTRLDVAPSGSEHRPFDATTAFAGLELPRRTSKP